MKYKMHLAFAITALFAATGCVAEGAADSEQSSEAMVQDDLAATTIGDLNGETRAETQTINLPHNDVKATGAHSDCAPRSPGVDLTRDPEPQPWNDPRLKNLR